MSSAVEGTRTRARAIWLRRGRVDHGRSARAWARVPSAAPARAPEAPAPGAPGGESYFDLARKDCVGTARNDHLQGVVHGRPRHAVGHLLADRRRHQRRHPAVRRHRRAQLHRPAGARHDLHEPRRRHRHGRARWWRATPLTATASPPPTSPTRPATPCSCRRVLRARPTISSLCGSTRWPAAPTGRAPERGRKLGPVWSPSAVGPHLQAFNTNTTTNAANRHYAVPTFETLEASHGFAGASVGYATDPRATASRCSIPSTRSPPYASAPNGRVALTARVRVAGREPVRLALGFGTTDDRSRAVTAASLSQSFASALRSYLNGWRGFDMGLRHPSGAPAIRRHYQQSINVVRASEDKTFPGRSPRPGLAMGPVGPGRPADQRRADLLRLLPRGVLARPLRSVHRPVTGRRCSQRPGRRPLPVCTPAAARRLDAAQLARERQARARHGRHPARRDRVSDPHGLGVGLSFDASLYQHHVIPAADFLVAHGPSLGSERWEEQSGYSPSTISAEIAGLTAASAIARRQGDAVHASRLPGHGGRLRPQHQGLDGDHHRQPRGSATSCACPRPATPTRRSPTTSATAASTPISARSSTPASRSWCASASCRRATPMCRPRWPSSTARSSARRPTGLGFYRYGTPKPGSEDGYGDCYAPDATSCSPTGAPWPPTDHWLGPPVAGAGRRARRVRARHREHRARPGRCSAPWPPRPRAATSSPSRPGRTRRWPPSPYGSNPATASIGFAPGEPAGSASPLTWAQAQYARLALSLSAGHNLDTPTITTERYVTHGMPGTLPLAVTSPANGSSVSDPDDHRDRHDRAGRDRLRRGRGGGRRARRRSPARPPTGPATGRSTCRPASARPRSPSPPLRAATRPTANSW